MILKNKIIAKKHATSIIRKCVFLFKFKAFRILHIQINIINDHMKGQNSLIILFISHTLTAYIVYILKAIISINNTRVYK